jgi:hypothetical protein
MNSCKESTAAAIVSTAASFRKKHKHCAPCGTLSHMFFDQITDLNTKNKAVAVIAFAFLASGKQSCRILTSMPSQDIKGSMSIAVHRSSY